VNFCIVNLHCKDACKGAVKRENFFVVLPKIHLATKTKVLQILPDLFRLCALASGLQLLFCSYFDYALANLSLSSTLKRWF